MKGNFVDVDDDDGSVVVMRHHEEVIPAHCGAALHSLCTMPAYRPLTQDHHSQALAQHCVSMYQACLEEGKCTPIAAVARATWLASLLLLCATLRQFKLLQQLWKSNQLPCYFMPPSCSSHRKMRMGQSKIFVLCMILKPKFSYLRMCVYFQAPVCPKVSKTEMPTF